MLQSMYTALSGMRAQQNNMDIIGNNVANINTVSFKGARTDFADALYSQMNKPLESGTYLQQGSGLTVAAVQRDMLQGTTINTGNTLDFMVDGPGYFSLAGPGGQQYYSRDGSFKVSVENGAGYLVTAEGYRVLGTNNQPIKIAGGTSALTADSAGTLSMNGVPFAALKITAFTNPSGLTDVGGNKYVASAASGAVAPGGQAVRQGWLEGSNVDLAIEMSRLIRAQKAFSVLGTAVKTADEMESLANNISK